PVTECRWLAAYQRAVQLRRRHVADHRAAGADGASVGDSHAAARDPLDLRAGLAGPSLLPDVRDECIGEPLTAAARYRHTALLDGDADHLCHVAGAGGVR